MKLLKELKEPELNDESMSDNSSLDDMGSLKGFSKIDSTSENGETNLNRQGMIRTVKNAHLIYKRENDTNRYDELWQYKSKENGIYHDIDIKNDILAGTDIPLNSLTSDDGEQRYELWNSGNIIFLKIYNLQN